MSDHERWRPHLSDEEVAAYLEPHGLPAVDRERIERHLLECDECRAEVVALNEVIASAPELTRDARDPRFRPRQIGGIAALLTAAVLAGLLLVTTEDPPGPTGLDTFRNGSTPTGSIPVLRAVSPVGEDVDGTRIQFRWTALGDETLYRFALLSASGEVIWSTETDRPGVDLPPAVAATLEPGRYYWRSDALLSDLSSATTGEQAFRVRP